MIREFQYFEKMQGTDNKDTNCQYEPCSEKTSSAVWFTFQKRHDQVFLSLSWEVPYSVGSSAPFGLLRALSGSFAASSEASRWDHFVGWKQRGRWLGSFLDSLSCFLSFHLSFFQSLLSFPLFSSPLPFFPSYFCLCWIVGGLKRGRVHSSYSKSYVNLVGSDPPLWSVIYLSRFGRTKYWRTFDNSWEETSDPADE